MNPKRRRREIESWATWLHKSSLAACCVVVAFLAYPPPLPAAAAAKQLPPLGIDVPADKRAALQKGLDALAAEIARLEKSPEARIGELLPDVQIFWQAVHTALSDQEFFKPGEIAAAKALLAEGLARAKSLANGEAPWANQHGLVVRGYVSRLDDSVQPYGLVVPKSYTEAGSRKYRLDLWFHGRGETLSEVNFLRDREKNVGTFAPPDTIVLHPYGRYCNANKFAGEIDVFEALDSVRRRYRIDEDRVVVRGFSMGGASTWHLAVHYPSNWAAANPGAGFAETPRFAEVFHKVTLTPTWWETRLYHLYDCTDWADNLRLCPTVAYSGEIDSQKQAADVMAEALQKEGLALVHVIGPKTKHSYHPQARDEVERRISALAAKGRERFPESVHFTTYTLRYNRCAWITVDALERHWERARIEAHRNADRSFAVRAENVKAFTIDVQPGAPVKVQIMRLGQNRAGGTSQTVAAAHAMSQSVNGNASFVLQDGRWVEGPLPDSPLRKKHGLQGPIDDAFMDAFLFVRPTGKTTSPEVGAWVQNEMKRAIAEWRRQFRGEPRVKDDKDVTPKDIDSMNLILWGDLSSNSANSLIAKIADKLPIRGEGSEIVVDSGRRFDAAHHVPILIYPNPLNPKRYVVLNSGFTFREHAYMSNALQIAKLPDWAIVDVRTPPDGDWPGKIAAADFFNEEWQLQPSQSH
jgi:pimeloyl-ACP methyl ester carboxylesterase